MLLALRLSMLSRPLIGRVDQNSLQAFYKRFSGHERTQMSDRQGADARRDATSGQFVCLCCPGAGALDQQSSARCWQAARRLAEAVAQRIEHMTHIRQ